VGLLGKEQEMRNHWELNLMISWDPYLDPDSLDFGDFLIKFAEFYCSGYNYILGLV
jgi:hypothetical protein